MESFGAKCKAEILNFWCINEGDVQVFINAVNDARECRAWFENLVEDIKKMSKRLPLWSINFIYKKGNQVVHCLVKHDLLLSNETI